jgi:hypothetical protein
VVELAFRRALLIQFVVSGAYQIDVLLLGNLIGEFPPGLRAVVYGVSLNPIPRINEQQI